MYANVNSVKTQNATLFWAHSPKFPDKLNAQKLAFWQSFPKATGELRIIQQANAVMLSDFKEICDSLQCDFWLHGGTLIGALRHSGSVPWDDDIDVAMTRSDFEKVKNYLFETSNKYQIKEFHYFDLAARAYRFTRKDINSNCFVDVFVYDNYNLTTNSVLSDWQLLCQYKKDLATKISNICSKLGFYLQTNNPLDNLPGLKSKIGNIFDSMINKSLENNTGGNYFLWGLDNNYQNETCYAYNHGRIFHVDDIYPFKKAMFEGREYNIPNNFEKYTEIEYGGSYLDMPHNFGTSVHYDYYFSDINQIEIAKQIISDSKIKASK